VAEQQERDSERRFRQLYDAHYWTIRAYALRRTTQPADADEIVATVFTSAWRHTDAPTDPSEQRVWLLGVARKTLANQRRGARRRWRLTERLKATSPAADPAAPGPEGVDPSDALERALATLSASERELVLLHLWEDLTHAELASLLGITNNAVAIRLHRARAKLRERLQPAAGAEPAEGTVPAMPGAQSVQSGPPPQPGRARGEVTDDER
jgi:RNA polymerase sigma-70 factor (ECF subfamily)